MPTYVYECAKCGDEFELYQSFAEDPLKKHPECGGKVAKVFQPVGIVLKGSGFYKNDSRSGGKRSKGGDSSKSDTGEKSEKSTKPESTTTASGTNESGGSGSGASDTKSSTKSDAKTSTSAGTST